MLKIELQIEGIKRAEFSSHDQIEPFLIECIKDKKVNPRTNFSLLDVEVETGELKNQFIGEIWHFVDQYSLKELYAMQSYSRLETYEEFQQAFMQWAEENQVDVELIDHEHELIFIPLGESADIILCRNSSRDEKKIEIHVGKELIYGFQHVNTVDLSIYELVESLKIIRDEKGAFIWPK